MRIGIDARLWNETGVGRYIRNLVWQLQIIDKKNEYVLFVKKGFNKKELVSPAGRLGSTAANFRLVETTIHWHSLTEQLKFPQLLYKENLDLMHFPYFSIPILYNRPFIITIHDLIIDHFPTGKASTLPYPVYYLKQLGYKFVINQAARKAQKVITVSEATKKEIVQHLPVSNDKVVVTYEGVTSASSHAIEKQSHKRLDNYFLYVGNAYPHKNLERLIDTFALLRTEYPDMKLVMVGKKNYFYDRLVEKVEDMQLQETVIFTGGIDDAELFSLYRHAEAFIFPSLMEGFGLPGLEAMKSGCLVLASDIPVFKEMYADAAVYFNPLAVDSMHATIRKVLENKKAFEKQTQQGLQLVKTFSWEKMANETISIYESSAGIRSSQ